MQKYVGRNVLECETILFKFFCGGSGGKILGSLEVEGDNVHSPFTEFRM
jgi:hypothetical protein